MFTSTLIPLRAATLLITVAGCGGAFQASSEHYRFEPVGQSNKKPEVQLRVRLMHLPDNQQVSDAVIYEQQVRMGMRANKDSVSWMKGEVSPATREGDGVYRLYVELPMRGEWTLYLTARVSGETEPVHGTVRIRAA